MPHKDLSGFGKGDILEDLADKTLKENKGPININSKNHIGPNVVPGANGGEEF